MDSQPALRPGLAVETAQVRLSRWDSFRTSLTCCLPPSNVVMRVVCDQRVTMPLMFLVCAMSHMVVTMEARVENAQDCTHPHCNMNNVGPGSGWHFASEIIRICSGTLFAGGAVTNFFSGPMQGLVEFPTETTALAIEDEIADIS